MLKRSKTEWVNAHREGRGGCDRERRKWEKSCYIRRCESWRQPCQMCHTRGKHENPFADRVAVGFLSPHLTGNWVRSSQMLTFIIILRDIFFWNHWKWISCWNLFTLTVTLQLHAINMLRHDHASHNNKHLPWASVSVVFWFFFLILSISCFSSQYWFVAYNLAERNWGV